MTNVEPTVLSALAPYRFADWLLVLGRGGEHEQRRELRMTSTCDSAGHGVWALDLAAGQAWPVARPRVRGNLVEAMHFAPLPEGKGAYSALERDWVRAMFLPRLLQHAPECGLQRKDTAMGAYSTVGTFELDGARYIVEWHPGEIQVIDPVGCVAAVMRLGPHQVLSRAAPGGSTAPAEVLDLLRAGAIEVLEQAQKDGRGPFALLQET